MRHYAIETPYFKASDPAAADEYITDLHEYAVIWKNQGNKAKYTEVWSVARALHYWFDGLVATEEIEEVKERIQTSLEKAAK